MGRGCGAIEQSTRKGTGGRTERESSSDPGGGEAQAPGVVGARLGGLHVLEASSHSRSSSSGRASPPVSHRSGEALDDPAAMLGAAAVARLGPIVCLKGKLSSKCALQDFCNFPFI